MGTHLIEALLPGPLGLDLDLVLTLNLPIVLRPISRVNDHAPDYHLDARGVELGYGWSKTSPVSGIPYVAVVITDPHGTRLSGVAWQAPDIAGRRSIQLQEICTVEFHA